MPRKLPPTVKVGHAVTEFFKDLESADLAESTIEMKQGAFALLLKQLPRGEHTLTRNLHDFHFRDALVDANQGGDKAENDYRRRRGMGQRKGRYGVSLEMYRGTYRQFARWLVKRGWVTPNFDPLYEITHSARKTGTRPPERIPKFRTLPVEEWPKFLDLATHPRDRMIMAVGLFWGRRGSEVAYIKWGDVRRDAGTVELYNLKKGRMVNGGAPMPMGPPMQREFDRYYTWWRMHYPVPADSEPFLPAKYTAQSRPTGTDPNDADNWPLRPRTPIDSKTIGRLVKTILRKMGWSSRDLLHTGGHTLRRSAAEAYDRHGGIMAVMALLDHYGSPATTLRYTRNREGRETLNNLMETSFDILPAPAPQLPPAVPPPPATKPQVEATIVGEENSDEEMWESWLTRLEDNH